MLNLMKNEVQKQYRRPRTWVMYGLLLVIIVGLLALIKFDKPRENTTWQQTVQQQTTSYQEWVKDENSTQRQKDYYNKHILINNYRLEHNIAPPDKDLWGSVLDMAQMVIFIAILTSIVAADIVAGEFSTGTIKLLLIRPSVRSKILLSKYLSVLLFSLTMLIVLFAGSFIVAGIFFGFGASGAPFLAVSGGQVVERSMLVHALAEYGLNCVSLIMLVTVAFMISTVFRSSSFAIGLSVGLLFINQILVALLGRYEWFRYYLFANTDLSVYLDGGTPLQAGMTMGFSIAVLVVYFVLMNLLSWTIFNKRDVAA
ncbi:ABC transporter permease [Gorillibacterium massiliense]|uniref:ABC transporter permease n=1 Tax=Gorillibacterium massiliense TaxID=1280390 RepID=UPI0004AE743A|nr:ABC transporter permease [Gorillibacterium massiliense]